MSRIEPEINIADVKSHEAWLRSLAWRILRNSDDVDDVVQDVWLANLRRSEPRSPSRAWLSSVTRNLSVTRLRRKTQRLDVEREAAREEELGENVQSAIESVCLYKRMLRWILELEEPYRETLLLRFARDLKLREVARLMDVPESTVRVRARRGLVILRKKARSEFSEERREQLVLILFGVPAARRALPSVVAVAAVVVTLAIPFGLWRILDGGDDSNAYLEPTVADAVLPRVARRAGSLPAASDTTIVPEEPGASLEIRGRIEFRRGGVLHDGRLDIEAVPFMVGRAMALPAMRPGPPSFTAGWEGACRVRVENGQPFRIPVKEAGRYRLMISMDGVRGALQFWSGTKHWTDADQQPPSTFDLLEGVEVVHEPEAHGRYEIGWRHRDGARREELHFDSGSARVEGLFMPRLRFRFIDLRNDQVWVRELNDSVTTVRLPELTRSSPFAIRGAHGGEALRDARLSVVFVPHDNHPWESSVAIHSPRHAELFLPVSASARLLELTATADGFLPRVLDLARSGPPASIELQRRRSIAGRLLADAGEDLEAVSVVAVAGRTPRLSGAVAPDGTFVLEPLASPLREELPAEGRDSSFWILGRGLYGRAGAAIEGGRVVLRPPHGKTFELLLRDAELEPVSGAKVIVLPWDGAPLASLMSGGRLTSDEEGKVSFGSVRGGQWVVDVRAPGFSPRRVVLDWRADAREPVTLHLTPAPEGRGTLTVLRPDGDPLPYAFVFCAEGGKPPLELRTDGRGRANLVRVETDGVPFDVTYPGFSPSLSSPATTPPGAENATVVMAPIVEVPCTVVSLDGGPTWVRCSSIEGTEGRTRLFRFEPGAKLPLTDEDQRLEFFRPGHAPRSVDVTDRSEPVIVHLSRGPRFEIADCEVGDRITLRPQLATSPRTAGDMDADFVLERVAETAVMEWAAITPGVYRVELRRAADGRSTRRRLEITSDTTIRRAELF